MFPIQYPAVLKPDIKGRGFIVYFPDLPEALTDGRSLPEALTEAADCLQEALAGRIVARTPSPPPQNRNADTIWRR